MTFSRRAAACGHITGCGCDVAACCLVCPLPVCRFEFRGGLRSASNYERDQTIVELRRAGWSNRQIQAAMAGECVSNRNIQRILKVAADAARAGNGLPVEARW